MFVKYLSNSLYYMFVRQLSISVSYFCQTAIYLGMTRLYHGFPSMSHMVVIQLHTNTGHLKEMPALLINSPAGLWVTNVSQMFHIYVTNVLSMCHIFVTYVSHICHSYVASDTICSFSVKRMCFMPRRNAVPVWNIIADILTIHINHINHIIY